MSVCVNSNCRRVMQDTWAFCPICGTDNRAPKKRYAVVQCLHEFYQGASFCARCGIPLQRSVQPPQVPAYPPGPPTVAQVIGGGPVSAASHPTAPAKTNNAVGAILGCVLLCCFCGFFGQFCKSPRNERFEAHFYSTEFVLERLRAPATADFSRADDSRIVETGEGEYVVEGYVDSQNGFGANIRSYWRTRVRRDGDAWDLLEIQID